MIPFDLFEIKLNSITIKNKIQSGFRFVKFMQQLSLTRVQFLRHFYSDFQDLNQRRKYLVPHSF